MSINICLIDRGEDCEAIQQLIAESSGRISRDLASIKKECNDNSKSYTLKAVDTSTDRVVGVSVWFIHTSQKQQGCWTVPTPHPHVYLYFISTQPTDEGARYAQSLMQWGLDRADSMGLEVWTHSLSPEISLYRGNGFVKVEEVLIESQYGLNLRRMAIDNRRVHKETYLDTNGFW